MHNKTFDKIPEKYNRHGESKTFQQIGVTKDFNGNFIIDIFYLTEIRTKKKIIYKTKNKKQWLIKKDGFIYNLFKEKLEEIYNKPISKEIVNRG